MTTAERPTLFSASMVRAILDGRKTQTRRVAKPRRRASLLDREDDGRDAWTDSYVLDPSNAEWLARDAPAKVGETMYVREAYRFSAFFDDFRPSDVNQTDDPPPTVFYEADGTPAPDLRAGKLRPGIHMPRWASRIEREVVSVRLERLQDCSEADARAEGIVMETADPPFYYVPGIWPHSLTAVGVEESRTPARDSYRKLWDYINGPGAWDLNPRVWVIEFSPS